MNERSSWYAEGLRWMGSVLNGVADYLDRPEPEPMPRHTSCEEILSETRTRLLSRSMASP